MNLRNRIFILVFLGLTVSCLDEKSSDDFSVLTYVYDFNVAQHGWLCGLSDYEVIADTASLEFSCSYTNRLSSHIPNQKSLMLSGKSDGDNVFMFMKKKLTNLAPDAEYTVTMDVELTSENETAAAGNSVYLKIGASTIEPDTIITEGFFTMNIDKGNFEESGQDMIVIGTIAPPLYSLPYTIIKRSNSSFTKPLKVQTDSTGVFWLIVGVDTGFTGTTTVYFTRINAILSRIN